MEPKDVRELPRSPGVYLYRNNKNKVIYVGKAKDLRSRVGSYFVGADLGPKTSTLVSSIKNISHIEVATEFEALLLEAELIKRYRPKFNISLKDDKSYKYIAIENVRIDGRAVPVIRTVRKKEEVKGALFGPFPEGRTVSEVLRSLRKIIPFRDCSTSKYKKYKKLGSPCLFGHLGLCSAPCVERISLEDYRKEISYIRRFLKGDGNKLLKRFSSEMKKASKESDFEQAAYFRDILRKYEYVSQRFRGAALYIDNPNLTSDLREKSLKELVEVIPSLARPPERIECYDISNLSGKEATASMVVAIGGKLTNSEYRRFKIKLKDSPDDFHMIEEVIRRRFRPQKEGNGWEHPDLLMIDGGKGQVSTVMKVFEELQIQIPVVGLAKQLETIVYVKDGAFHEVRLDRDNEGLKLLERLRDEAHRFARKYHHLLRLKKVGK